jgi:hypothetical protein
MESDQLRGENIKGRRASRLRFFDIDSSQNDSILSE